MSVDYLTIAMAVREFRISRKTLRRLLREGEVVGATSSSEGAEWVFPAASLERLGYARRNPNTRSDDGATAAAASTTGDGRRLALRPVLVVGVLLLVGLIAVLVAVPRGDDGVETAGDPVWAAIDEVSPAGAVVGVTGSGVAGVVPPDRDAVPIDSAADLEGGPGVVVAGADAPDDVQAVLADQFVSSAIDRGGETVWVHQRIATPDDGDEIAAGDSDAEDAPTTAGPPAPSDDADDSDPPADPEGSDGDGSDAAPDVPDAADGEPDADTGGEPDAGQSDDDDGAVDDGDDAAAPTPVGDGTYMVESGDNFWAIADQIVNDADGAATDADVVAYWTTLIDANADQLVDPGNADLILPGQSLVLPPLTAGT